MSAVKKLKNKPEGEMVTLSHDCWINDGSEDNSDPVILFTSPDHKSNDCWKDHKFTFYKAGTPILYSLWDLDYVYNLR